MSKKLIWLIKKTLYIIIRIITNNT
jgi:hypothetical protein